MQADANYIVSIPASDLRLVQVEACLNLDNHILMMASWGHPDIPEGWARFVHNLELRDSEGETVSVHSLGNGRWQVDAVLKQPLHLSYDVRLEHDRYDWGPAGGETARPAIRNETVFWVTKALFIAPSDLEMASVTFKVPKQWTVSTAWRPVAGGECRFIVDSLESLINNALVIGQHRQRLFDDGDMTVVLAIDRGLIVWEDLFFDVIRRQLKAYRSLFGGLPHVNYLIALAAADEDDGEAFNSSFNQSIVNDGVDAKTIIWANVLGHELFHFWNGTGLLVPQNHEEVEWFTEGFTGYYANLTLVRTAIVDEALFFKKLERHFGRYHIARRMFPGEKTSLVEAGKDKGRNWLLIYGGGAAIALCLDIEIRSRTRNQRSLDDVMVRMVDMYGRTGVEFEYEDIRRIVSQVGGTDLADFLARYVEGKEEFLSLYDSLDKAGLRLSQFADEYYISRVDDPTALQRSVLTGLLRQG